MTQRIIRIAVNLAFVGILILITLWLGDVQWKWLSSDPFIRMMETKLAAIMAVAFLYGLFTGRTLLR